MNARFYAGRSANDAMPSFDATGITLRIFGPGLVITIVVTATWLASIWR